MSVPCVHRKTVDRCAICGGFRRFVAERFEDPHKNTPAARRAFWKYGGPSIGEEAMEIRDRQIADSPGPNT